MLNGFGLRRRAWSGWDGLELSDLIAAAALRPPLGGVAPSETRPKMTNRFWDDCAYMGGLTPKFK